jgi:hypothetical protein
MKATRQELSAILESRRFDVWNFSGNHNKDARQQLMLAITGEKRPKAKCGVTELSAELEKRFPHKASASCAARYPHALKWALSAEVPAGILAPISA